MTDHSLRYKLRARDPYYRITGRDPSQSPPRAIAIIAVSIGALIGALSHGLFVLAIVFLAFVLGSELVARGVERRRQRPPS
jgi:multisubunit Na+/H+ antiporter MnhG subunit